MRRMSRGDNIIVFKKALEQINKMPEGKEKDEALRNIIFFRACLNFTQ
jgi:hypothetical protein